MGKKRFQKSIMRFIILCLVLGAVVSVILSGSVMAYEKADNVKSAFYTEINNEVSSNDIKNHSVGHARIMVHEDIGSAMKSDTLFVELGVIVGQMKYDKTRITVKAGKAVVIVFHNNDVMLHNILILEPGSLDQVGMAADKMVADPDAMEKGFIPDLDAVLHASPLVNPGNTYRLIFTAPEKAGEYPFVCTFPGHWRMMQGVMKVE